MARSLGMDDTKGPLSGLPPTDPQGPLRRAPRYYAGERYGRRRMNHPDVERHPNGAIAGIRNKAARRLIRKAYKAVTSTVEQRIKFARALKAQAREVVSDEHYDKSRSAQSYRARRLLDAELAIHQEVYVPDQKQLRAMRTEKRRQKRRGEQDFIGQLVDRMAEEKKL